MRSIRRWALGAGLAAACMTTGCFPYEFVYVFDVLVEVRYIDENGKKRSFNLINGEDYSLEFDGMIGGLDGTYDATFGGWGPFSDTLDVKKGRHVKRKFGTKDSDAGAILNGVFGAKTGQMASWDRISGQFKGSQYPGGQEFKVNATLNGWGTFSGGEYDGLEFKITIKGKDAHVPFGF
ncbi:MAG: hypothetical protein HMLKMBBP_01840 [Planctomycetes bacterium]|nr:hypothetical protein [Planctomycetota bacterium]